MSNIYALCMHLEWQQVMQAAVLHIWIIGEVFVFHQHMSRTMCFTAAYRVKLKVGK